MKRAQTLRIEGLSPEDLLELPEDEFRALILTGKPIAFRAGTAEVLGQFETSRNRLLVELAHIDGGGEGVLPAIVALARKYATRRSISSIEWFVYATNCARPNPKLLRVLQRRGFVVREIEGKGDCYHLIEAIDSTNLGDEGNATAAF